MSELALAQKSGLALAEIPDRARVLGRMRSGDLIFRNLTFAAALAMTADTDWAGKPALNLLLGLGGRADWKAGLAKVRAVAAGLRVTEAPVLRVMAKGASPAARAELRDVFGRQTGTTGETGEWVFLDTPADRAGGFAALRTIFAPAK